MIKTILLAVFWLVPAVFSFVQLRAEDFKLVKQDNQISLYEKWIQSNSGGKIRELKAVFKVHADMAAIIQLLTDQHEGVKWNVQAAVYKIVKTANDNQWLTYTRYDLPWPFKDQDCCLLYQLKESADKVEISFKSALSSRFPITTGSDRMTGVYGKWLLEKTGDNRVCVTYLITTDRSKNIPRWISDRVIHSNLFSTLSTFRDMAEQSS